MKPIQSLTLVIFAVLLGACASDPADQQAQAVDVKVVDGPVDPTTAGGEDPNETVCTRQHKVGSHFPRTVCKTRREWDEERRNAQDDLRRSQSIESARRASGFQDGG